VQVEVSRSFPEALVYMPTLLRTINLYVSRGYSKLARFEAGTPTVATLLLNQANMIAFASRQKQSRESQATSRFGLAPILLQNMSRATQVDD
jgi:hypothetical protein